MLAHFSLHSVSKLDTFAATAALLEMEEASDFIHLDDEKRLFASLDLTRVCRQLSGSSGRRRRRCCGNMRSGARDFCETRPNYLLLYAITD